MIVSERANLRINAIKSSFRKTEIDNLGYVVTHKGITPQQKKIEARLNIDELKTVTEVRIFQKWYSTIIIHDKNVSTY